jgi:hypothetical protein
MVLTSSFEEEELNSAAIVRTLKTPGYAFVMILCVVFWVIA